MMLTTKKILALGPCEDWTAKRIDKLLEPRGGSIDAVRALDCRTLRGEDGPSLEERAWLGIRLLPDDNSRRLMACRWARRALRREKRAGREPDVRSWAAVRVAEQYARGEASRGDLRRAYAADAARDAAHRGHLADLRAALSEGS